MLLIHFYEYSEFNMNFNDYNVYILVHIDA